jgi:hypothetical protein
VDLVDPPGNGARTYAVTTTAGGTQGFADGLGGAARFDAPGGLAFVAPGHLYVGDGGNHRVRVVR